MNKLKAQEIYHMNTLKIQEIANKIKPLAEESRRREREYLLLKKKEELLNFILESAREGEDMTANEVLELAVQFGAIVQEKREEAEAVSA